MKKTKKLLACLIAAATMFGMGTTAFAAENSGKVQVPTDGTVQFEKEYKLIGEGTSPAETFEFAIENTDVADAAGTVTKENMPIPTVGSVAYDAAGATAGGNKKSVTVTLPTYTSVGVYTYTINETPGKTAGVTYDATPVTMKVTVVNGATDGTFKVESVSFTKNGKKLVDEAAFTNTYSAGKLNISKTVTGNLGDKSKYFEFKVTLTGVTGKTYGESYAVSGGSESTNPKSIKIGEETTFELKHGDTISIANLPYGVTYIVTETAAEGYRTTKTGDTGSVNAADQTAAFTNNKDGKIDTGVNLTTLPYILVFAGVIVIAGAAFITRRRKFED